MLMAFAGLFISAFLAATLVPAASEVAVVAMLVGGYDPWLVGGVATVGNVLGSCVNWVLGRYASTLQDRRWFPIRRSALERAERWFARWGRPCLLLAWVPGIGDAVTIAAGALRVGLPLFVLLVTLSKAGRYAVVIWLAKTATAIALAG